LHAAGSSLQADGNANPAATIDAGSPSKFSIDLRDSTCGAEILTVKEHHTGMTSETLRFARISPLQKTPAECGNRPRLFGAGNWVH